MSWYSPVFRAHGHCNGNAGTERRRSPAGRSPPRRLPQAATVCTSTARLGATRARPGRPGQRRPGAATVHLGLACRWRNARQVQLLRTGTVVGQDMLGAPFKTASWGTWGTEQGRAAITGDAHLNAISVGDWRRTSAGEAIEPGRAYWYSSKHPVHAPKAWWRNQAVSGNLPKGQHNHERHFEEQTGSVVRRLRTGQANLTPPEHAGRNGLLARRCGLPPGTLDPAPTIS